MTAISQKNNIKGIAIGYLFSYCLYILFNSITSSISGFFLKSSFYFKLYYLPCILCDKPSKVSIDYTNNFFLSVISLKIVLLLFALVCVKKSFFNPLAKELIIFLFLYDIIFTLLYPFTYLTNFNYLQWYSCSNMYLYSFCRSNNINEIIPLGISSFIGLLSYKYLDYSIREIMFRVGFGLLSFISYCLLWYVMTEL